MEKNLATLQKEVEDIISADDLASARNLFYQVNQWLRENQTLGQTDPKTYQEYKTLSAKLSFVLLSTLKDEDIVNLFQKNLAEAFEMYDFDPLDDIARKLKIILLSKVAFEERDKFKKSLVDALLKNQQNLFRLKEGIKQKTITGWLLEYINILGVKPIDNKAKMLEYLTRISAENQLLPEQKERLLKLFNLFEFLKLPSFSPQGIEERVTVVDEEGQLKVYEAGREVTLGKIKEAKILPFIGKKSEIVAERAKEEAVPSQTEELGRAVEKVELFKGEPLSGKTEEYEGIEEEVEKLKKEKPIRLEEGMSSDQTVENIIKQTGLSFTDEVLINRFKNITISYLRDVRDEVEIRQVLKRPQKIGGMELDEPTVNEIIKIFKEEKAKIVPEILPKKEEKSASSAGKPELAEGIATPTEIIKGGAPILASEEKKSEPAVVQKFEFGTLAPPVEEAKKVPEKKEERLIRPISAPPEILTTPPQPPSEESLLAAEKLKTTPIVRIRRPPLPPGRPVVEEIKVRPRIYGPIDELRNFRLADWQRLGSGKEVTERIFEKIQLLGEESLQKKAQGIRAWKESEVHLLYLDIGAEAIDKGKTVEEVIRDRGQENQTTLSPEDFEVIGELNQKLRF